MIVGVIGSGFVLVGWHIAVEPGLSDYCCPGLESVGFAFVAGSFGFDRSNSVVK